ncbi:unnamed protein product [Schistosoma mattheei]|uniref:T-complex protein 1 subunit beta n=2 Tax=Schistosoma mattheei TaxID=31246 RepID=A0AA85AYE1_9TREM|nr:unnamed protein product [Schistosoma mattheei]
MLSLQPISILSAGADEERQKPPDLLLWSIGVDNPAAKILVEMSKVQDDEVGDGTTSVTVLAAELLREGEQLIAAKLHPQTIVQGWREATKLALAALDSAAHQLSNQSDAEFRNRLLSIARTLCKFSVDAVLRLKGSGNLDAIQIIQKLGGTMTDSYLDEGFLLDKRPGVNQPKRVENAKILIANTPMDADKIKVFGSKIQVDAISKVAELELAEKQKMKDKVDKILKHNCSVFINRQLIYNYPEQLFADAGIMAIEHADFEGVERLALVTGGEIVSTFDSPETTKLGHCDLIEEVTIGEDKLLRFSGVAMGEACTIVLRGATKSILAEAERSLHDSLCVLALTVKNPRTVCGGGAMEMWMAEAVAQGAAKTPGKISLAMESFGRALRRLPSIIADNGGYDSADLISQLRASHANGEKSMGLDMNNGVIADMNELGIIESYDVKHHLVTSAAEAAEMIIRVDDIIKAAPRRRAPRRH